MALATNRSARTPVVAGTRRRHRVAWLVLCVAVLLVLVAVSVAVGSRYLPPRTVLAAILDYHATADEAVVRTLRLPRTAVGLVVGVALGLAGALMQALTRNPLADPGLLGVNAGAAAAVVVAVGFLHLGSLHWYVWFAFAGAAAVSVAVYVLGSRGTAVATPVRLALAGAALTAALGSFCYGVVVLRPTAFDQFRFWQLGSLAGRNTTVLVEVTPFIVVGGAVALMLGGSLNALALGDDTGRALGARPGRTRALAAVAVTLLCGAATAAAGPIAFVGLVAPHVARGVMGPDQRWVLGFSLVFGPVLLVAADVLGRVVARPGELEAGVVTAFLGAAVLVALVRTGRAMRL